VPSRRVTRALDELVAVHGCPSAIRVDNGLPQRSSGDSSSDLTTRSARTAPDRQAGFHQRGIAR
jgi:hypothetical protein